jgi:hypothetical protein
VAVIDFGSDGVEITSSPWSIASTAAGSSGIIVGTSGLGCRPKSAKNGDVLIEL